MVKLDRKHRRAASGAAATAVSAGRPTPSPGYCCQVSLRTAAPSVRCETPKPRPCSQHDASNPRALHQPAASCLRKRAGWRRADGRSFEQLLLSGDTAAAACAAYLAPSPGWAAGGDYSGSVAVAQQEPLRLQPSPGWAAGGDYSGSAAAARQEPPRLQPDTPPKPVGPPRLLLSRQSTRVLLSPRSRGTLSSDAANACAAGNDLGESMQPGGLPSPMAVAAAAPLAAALPPPALLQLARAIEMQLAQQALQEQLAQQALHAQQEQQLAQAMQVQLAREVQAAWLAQCGAQQAQQVQQAQQAPYVSESNEFGSGAIYGQACLVTCRQFVISAVAAGHLSCADSSPGRAPPCPTRLPCSPCPSQCAAPMQLPNAWLLHGSGPSTRQQPAAPAPVAPFPPLSPGSGYSPQQMLAWPALQLPGNSPQPGVGALQGYGQPSLTPLSSLVPCAASLLMFGGAAGRSPFADSRPSLFSGGEGQPGTPRLMQPPASPRQPAADASARPKRPPPCTEVEWLLSQLPPPSPAAQTPPGPAVQSSYQPVDGVAAPWHDAASLVQGLPPSYVQPLLQPVEPLQPPPPLPKVHMLQPAPAPLPTEQALPPCEAEPPGSEVLGGASSLAPGLPLGLEGQPSEQLLLSFLDGELLDMDKDLLDLIA